jgi:hypothetical protein
MSRTKARPRPVPFSPVVKKGSKIFPRSSGGTPGPLSRTSQATCPGSARAASTTLPLAPAALMALRSRLRNARPQLSAVRLHHQLARRIDRDRRPHPGSGPARRRHLHHLVEQRPQRDRRQLGPRPARVLQEVGHHVLQVLDLALDAGELGQALGLVAQPLAQQPGVQLQPAQRVAHLVGDPGEHHLQPLVARAQGRAHLVEARGQPADLVARLHRHRALQLAPPDAIRRLRQPANAARSAAAPAPP